MSSNGRGQLNGQTHGKNLSDTPDRSRDIESVFRVIRDRWILIFACVVVLGGIALIVSQQTDKKYTATAKLLFRDPGFDQNLFGATVFPGSTDPDRAAATNQQTVGLTETYRRTAAKLPGVSYADLKSSVEVIADGNSDFVSIEATTTSPARSTVIANNVARSFVSWRRQNDVNRIEVAEKMLTKQLNSTSGTSTQSEAIQRNIERLKLLASVQTGNVEFAQRATVPGSPSSPNVRLNVLFGLGLGLLLGLSLAFLRARVDRRLRDEGDIAEVTDLPILGGIVRTKGSEPEISDGTMRDSFIALRSRLRYFNVDRDISTILITSAAPGEGKSTVSMNLAAAAASLGERVILIEADFRKPVFAERLGIAAAPGLSETLAGGISRTEVTSPITVPVGFGESADPSFDVIPCGGTPPNPQQLLESKGMTALLDELAAKYDLVIIDTPPVLQVPDAIPMVRLVDGVVVVCRSETSTRHQLQLILEEIAELDGNVLGIAFNGIKRKRHGYGYGYGYGYGDSKAEEGKKLFGAVSIGRKNR